MSIPDPGKQYYELAHALLVNYATGLLGSRPLRRTRRASCLATFPRALCRGPAYLTNTRVEICSLVSPGGFTAASADLRVKFRPLARFHRLPTLLADLAIKV